MYPYSLEKSKNGRDILKINNRYIHSKFAPEKEAQNITYPGRNLIAVFGLGLAYHVNNLISANPESLFIVYEPHPEIRKNFLSYLKRAIPENLLIVDSLDENTIYSFIDKSDVIYQGRIYTYSNTGYKSLYQEEESRFYALVKKSFELVVQNVMTEASFLPLWTKNILYNLHKAGRSPLAEIKGSRKGENVAVIVCSGPSSDFDMQYLKTYRDSLTIFAVDTSLKPLIKQGIVPDFAVSLDGQYYSLDDFIPGELDDCYFIFDILSYPGVQRFCKHACFTFMENLYSRSLLGFFAETLNLKASRIESGGTVSDFALNCACLAGFTKIYFTGLDLGFPGLLTHCKHSPYYDRLLYSSNYMKSPLTQIVSIISARNVYKTEAKKSKKGIFSDFILKNYASYFEYFARNNPGISLFYTAEEGLKLEGFTGTTLEELIKEGSSKRISHREITESWNKQELIPKEYHKTAAGLAEDLYGVTTELSKILETEDFAGNPPHKLEQYGKLYGSITSNFPFMAGFTLMTRVILSKKSIYQGDLIWYKHIFFKMLQSMYFIIRTVQKTIKLEK